MARKPKDEHLPWHDADPTRRVGINVPMPEPLMKQLDYLIEHKMIRSKSSFIRDVVSAAATDEIHKLWRMKDAMRLLEQQERRKR